MHGGQQWTTMTTNTMTTNKRFDRGHFLLFFSTTYMFAYRNYDNSRDKWRWHKHKQGQGQGMESRQQWQEEVLAPTTGRLLQTTGMRHDRRVISRTLVSFFFCLHYTFNLLFLHVNCMSQSSRYYQVSTQWDPNYVLCFYFSACVLDMDLCLITGFVL